MLVCLSAASVADDADLLTVEAFDLVRYMGRWHQIALLPNRFQTDCVGETTAEYRFIKNAEVRVVNQCREVDGELHSAEGAVRRNANFDDPARLEVRFAPAWLSLLPAVWGDYWVMDVEADYSAAMVGSPNREYLWILARGQAISAETYSRFVASAKRQGFAVSLLEREPGKTVSNDVGAPIE